MKNSGTLSKTSVFTILALIVLTFLNPLSARDFYQLKIYTIKDKDQEAMLDTYLEKAFVPAMHRAGVKHIGVFKPIETDAAAGTKVFVFVPLKKMDDLDKLTEILAKNKDYIAAGSDYINAPWDKPPFVRFESIVLKAFSEMPGYYAPKHATPSAERIYELRSYEGPTEKLYRKKVEMFNEGGEVALFRKLDFQAMFYAEVVSGSTMPNLMYMTTFPDMKVHDQRWDAFRAHPDWKTLSAKEEYKNTVSKSVKYLLHPTSYSDL